MLPLCMLLCALLGAEPNQLTEPEKAEGWQLLFDGRTFEGWRGAHGTEAPREYWVIEDGCLRTVASETGRDIFTAQSFRDFELTLEWKVSPAGNSGVFYNLAEGRQTPRMLAWFYGPLRRSAIWYAALLVVLFGVGSVRRLRRLAVAAGLTVTVVAAWGGLRFWKTWESIRGSAVGMEMQVLDDERHPDGQRGPQYRAGALYDLVPVSRQVVRPVGEFNQARVLVRGNHVEHWLNGEKVVEYELGSPELERRIAESKFREMAGFGRKTASPIALQHHHDVVWFRTIKIRRLAASE